MFSSQQSETQTFDILQQLIGSQILGSSTSTESYLTSNYGLGYTKTNLRASVWYSILALDTVFKRAYWYDSANRVSVLQQGSGSLQRQYKYDQLGRLDTVAYRKQLCQTWPGTLNTLYGWNNTCVTNPDSIQAYSYDAVGNRTEPANDYYTSGNEQQVFGRYHYTFDADGNVTQKTDTVANRTWRYGWDALNRLIWVKRVGGDSVTYEYDALGRLARRRMNGTLDRHWLYVGGHIAAELDGSMHPLVEYAYMRDVDHPYASMTFDVHHNYTVARHVVDESGNVVGQIGSGGTSVVQKVNYDAWGKPSILVNSGSGNKLLWKGLMWEDTVGLYYVRNRWYDPDVGRFISEDPIGIQGGINMYVFGNDDPINTADPYGLCVSDDINCQNLVRMLRQEHGKEFQDAADEYDDYQGHVYFVALAQLTDAIGGQLLGLTVKDKNPRVYLVGEQSRPDFLITAVHESMHLRGHDHDQALIQHVYDAWMELSQSDRNSAVNAANFLFLWTNGQVGKPLF